MEPGYAAICLNMDSVGQALGWPIDHRDPVYHQVLDRFLTLAQWFDFKYTVQVVGRDLLVREHFDQIRRLSEAGHEIGNHTWSYQPALGEIGAWWLESEILDTHSKIAECIGREPKGFATPCWGYSPRIVKALARLGYRYDASLLPCARCLPPDLSSVFRNWAGLAGYWRGLRHRDREAARRAPREPFFVQGLLVFPAPTTAGRWETSVWHGCGRAAGWHRHFALLRQALDARRYFYYAVHASDLLCAEDFQRGPRQAGTPGKQAIERQQMLSEALRIICDSGRQMVTMNEMSERVRAEMHREPEVLVA